MDATPVNDQVRLTFILRLVYRFQYIHLKGDLGLSKYAINRKIRLRKREPYTPEKALKGREDILAILQENGYYRATVTPDVLLHRSTKQTEVTYTINAGPRAVVGSIAFTGDTFFSTANLLKMIKSRPEAALKKAASNAILTESKRFTTTTASWNTSSKSSARIWMTRT